MLVSEQFFVLVVPLKLSWGRALEVLYRKMALLCLILPLLATLLNTKDLLVNANKPKSSVFCGPICATYEKKFKIWTLCLHYFSLFFLDCGVIKTPVN